MEFCTNLQQRVLDLENIKTAQAQEITSLKLRVKKLEKKGGSRTHKLKRLYKVGRSARVISSDEASLGDQEDSSKQGRKIDDIDKDAEITLVHETQGRYGDEEMFDTGVLDGDEDKVETDYELAQRLQAEEQEELTIKDKSKLFQQLLEKRRKHFAAKRAEERRNRPPTKAQQRSIMCTYLKNMAGWKPKDLKTKSFANVQELFDKAMKRVNTFVNMDTELVEGSETREESSSKRAGDELEQEPSKKQKVDDDKETEELKQCMEIISDDGDDVTIEATPYLPTLQPLFGSSWSIVKARFKKTEPVNYMDIFLHLNLKTMGFEHSIFEENILYLYVVEKMYPLTKHTLHQMFNDVKLQVDYSCENAFELLRLVKKLS
ncbi:hypothetical protein Tco_1406606 [Tanacetum coccineum]